MERNLDRKTLSFSKGMTNVPSDLLSEDSELAYSQNIIYRNGEMVPIQKMEPFGTVSGTILFVHKMADFENIITYDRDPGTNKYTIRCYKMSDLKTAIGTFEGDGEVKDAQAVGNTLVLATDNGLRYIRHIGKKYKDLGTDIPEPKFRPMFSVSNKALPKTVKNNIISFVDKADRVNFSINGDGTINYDGSDWFYDKLKTPTDTDKYDNLQTSIKGTAAQAINIVKQNNYFIYPFFIRFAWKLYDGTYAKISNPIICYPTARRSGNFLVWDNYTGKPNYVYIQYAPYYGKLHFEANNQSIGEWDDIIKELVVFATTGVPQFNIDDDWIFREPDSVDSIRYDGITFSVYKKIGYYFKSITDSDFDDFYHVFPRNFIEPKSYKTDEEIIDELMKKSQFYKLFSMKIGSEYMDGKNYDAKYVIRDHTVENLTTQEQLPKDDYYGWTKTVTDNLYVYNNRINMLGIKRYPFCGFNLFTAVDKSSGEGFTFYTHIVSDTMDAWVKSDNVIVYEGTIPGWLYYPDPHATEMIIRRTTSDLAGIRVKLSQHPMLNGAYAFVSLPSNDEISGNVAAPTVDTNAYETLDSQIFTSVVNNPFVFEASGDNTVGTGKILGIVANTEAVSQGQFGQYPLLVFTDEGIYAMSVNAEGLYSSIHPISREVCNNADSITPTDKVVYFTSEKGLMATSGGEAICVSGQLSGGKNRGLPSDFLPFKTFLENCLIAYDYKASLLRIFNKKTSYHYVYNMVDKIFSISHNYTSSKIFCRTVANNYPDNLVQFDDSTVYSLTNIPLAEDDANDYDCIMTTRSLKLGGSTILKSLRGLKHLFDSDTGTVSVRVYGSNNGKDWVALKSLFGKPWKYFKLEYSFKNFKASDSFAGSIIETQSRREDKIR